MSEHDICSLFVDRRWVQVGVPRFYAPAEEWDAEDLLSHCAKYCQGLALHEVQTESHSRTNAKLIFQSGLPPPLAHGRYATTSRAVERSSVLIVQLLRSHSNGADSRFTNGKAQPPSNQRQPKHSLLSVHSHTARVAKSLANVQVRGTHLIKQTARCHSGDRVQDTDPLGRDAQLVLPTAHCAQRHQVNSQILCSHTQL